MPMPTTTTLEKALEKRAFWTLAATLASTPTMTLEKALEKRAFWTLTATLVSTPTMTLEKALEKRAFWRLTARPTKMLITMQAPTIVKPTTNPLLVSVLDVDTTDIVISAVATQAASLQT